MGRVLRVLGTLAVLAALALLPLVERHPYPLHVGILLLLAVAQGSAWNVIGGYAGQYSVGHAAFFGLGGYVTMMLLEDGGIAPWWGIWPAMGAAVLLALVVGSITFRLRGPYFVLASIAVAEIIRLAAVNWRSVTRGAEGILLTGIPPLHLGGLTVKFIYKPPFYEAALGLAALTVGASWLVRHSKLGYYLQAIREDQDAAHSLGISLAFHKNAALAISAAFTAAAGGITALYVRFIDPSIAFGLDVSVQMVLLAIIGGIGTTLGPVIGALVLIPLSEALRNDLLGKWLVGSGLVREDSRLGHFLTENLSHAHVLVYGILVVVVILFAPDGILGIARGAAARLRRRLSRGRAGAEG